jgi:hypothetical protein
MTMRRRTLLFLCSDFWPLKTCLWSPPFLLAWLVPLWFLFVSENEIESKRETFPGSHWRLEIITDRPTWDSKNSVSAVLTAVTETLDPSHKLGRWIYWRGQQRVIRKLKLYFVIDSVRKTSDTPSYKVLCYHSHPHLPYILLNLENNWHRVYAGSLPSSDDETWTCTMSSLHLSQHYNPDSPCSLLWYLHNRTGN